MVGLVCRKGCNFSHSACGFSERIPISMSIRILGRENKIMFEIHMAFAERVDFYTFGIILKWIFGIGYNNGKREINYELEC